MYEENSTSRKVIDDICDSYCLVNLVDNDFVRESCLFEIIQRCIAEVIDMSPVDENQEKNKDVTNSDGSRTVVNVMQVDGALTSLQNPVATGLAKC